MKAFILVLVMVISNGITTTAIRYPSEHACEVAREKYEKDFSANNMGFPSYRMASVKGSCAPAEAEAVSQ